MTTDNIAYAGSTAFTLTVASLASSATLVAGRESAAVSNTTNLYVDSMISGKITTGTTPTAGTIEVWAYAALDDTPTYPDVFDGTDSAETVTSADIKYSALRLVASMKTDTTSDQAYPFAPVSLVSLFGQMPTHYGIFVTHDTVAALNSTAGNHFVKHNGITYTNA